MRLKQIILMFLLIMLIGFSARKASSQPPQSDASKETELWETPTGLILYMAQINRRDQLKAQLSAADYLKSAEEKKGALIAVENACKIARKINTSNKKTTALLTIASKFLYLEEKSRALETLKEAENEIEKISDTNFRIYSLMEISESYYWYHKQKKKSLTILNQSLKLALTLEEGGAKSDILNRISDKYSRFGETKQAIEVAQKIKTPLDKYRALRDIAIKIANSEQLTDALALVQKISGAEQKQFTLHAIALNLVREKKVKSALKVIKEAKNQSKMINRVAISLAEEGEIQQALELAQKIKEKNIKNSTLIGIAHALATAKVSREYFIASVPPSPQEVHQNRQRASSILKQILPDMTGKSEATPDSNSLIQAASVFVKSGKNKEAIDILNQVLKDVQKLKSSRKRDSLLSKISQTLAKAGDIKQATELTRLLKKNTDHRWNALLEIAENLAKKRKAKEAMSIAMKIENQLMRASTMVRISIQLKIEGKKKESVASMEQALKQAMKIEKEYYRDVMLGMIVSALVKRGELDQALKVTSNIKSNKLSLLSRRINFRGTDIPAYDRASALKQIALAFRKSCNTTRFLETIGKIEVPSVKGDLLHDYAFTFIKKKDIKKAIELSRQINKPSKQAYALRGIILKLANFGKFDQAIELASTIKMPKTNKPDPFYLTQIATTLAFDTRNNHGINNMWFSHQMKKSFTPQEKQLAKQLVQLMQAN